MPAITVGVLTYNRRDTLEKAIQSAYDQHYPDMEVLVVDSASQDGTCDMVQTRFPEARVIRLPRNLGCPGGRNRLYEQARGEYIINLDDDGWLGERMLEKIVTVFETDPTIGIVAFRQCSPEEEIAGGIRDNAGILEASIFKGGVSAFRSKMLKDIGLYPEDFFFFAEEEYLAIRAMNAGYRIVYCPDIIMRHPVCESGTSPDVRWDFYKFRNPLLVVARVFPTWLMIKYLILRSGSYFLISLRRGSFGKYLAAMGSLLWHLPSDLLTRKPCSPEAVKKYFRLRPY